MTQKSLSELRPLTGVRAVAAMWVLGLHLRSDYLFHIPGCRTMAEFFFSHGYLGVDLFFILSGFILYYNYAKWFQRVSWKTYRSFLWLRLARLYPVHLVTLFFLGGIIIGLRLMDRTITAEAYYSWPNFVWNLLLIQGWTIPLHPSWNGVAWSISCEWFAYLLFPCIVALGIAGRTTRQSILIIGCALFIAAIPYQLFERNAEYGLIHVAGEFTAGCCLGRLYLAEIGQNLPWKIIVPVVVVSFIPFVKLLKLLHLVSYFATPLLALTILGLAYGRCQISRVLSTNMFLYGGRISYSLYMVHGIILAIANKIFSRFPCGVYVETSVVILSVFLIAGAVFHFVEEPARHWMRQFIESNASAADYSDDQNRVPGSQRGVCARVFRRANPTEKL